MSGYEGTSAAEVNAAWAMKDILDLLEVDYDDGGSEEFKIFSIFKEENTPSLHIYRDHWYDFSTGQGHSPIDFVMAYTGCSFGRAMRLLERGVGDPLDYAKPKVAKAAPEPLPDHAERLQSEAMLLEEAEATLHGKIEAQWALPWQVLAGWNVRVDRKSGSLWIPHCDPTCETVPGIKVRDLWTGRKFSVKPSKFTQLYSRWWLDLDDRQPIFLCEGESDAWTLTHQGHWNVYAIPSGGGNIKGEWFEPLSSLGVSVWYCHDNDEVGLQSFEKVKRHMAGRLQALPPPDDFKDVNEAWRAGVTLKAPRGGAPSWVRQ